MSLQAIVESDGNTGGMVTQVTLQATHTLRAGEGNILQPAQPVIMSSTAHALYRKKTKNEVCDSYIAKLVEREDIDVSTPGFIESIRQHFDKLPTRYALDVNLDSLDVLSHKRLLDEARADPTAVSFAVRPVEIIVPKHKDTFESPTSPQVSAAVVVVTMKANMIS